MKKWGLQLFCSVEGDPIINRMEPVARYQLSAAESAAMGYFLWEGFNGSSSLGSRHQSVW